MPERTVVTEQTQVGVETTPGTGVAANKRLRSVGFNFDPEFNARTFVPSGQKWPTVVAPGKEWVGGDMDGAADYNEIIYPLSMIFGAATVTTPGGGTNSRTHTWTIAPAALQDPKTFTIERGSTVRAEKSVYVFANEFGLTINRDEVGIEGAIIGQQLQDGITLTASPTVVALQPILGQHVSVYFDTAFGSIGTTKLLRVLEAGIGFSDRFGTLWPLDAAQASYISAYEIMPNSEISLTQVADAAGMGHLTRARAGTVGYLRIEAVGPIAEAAVNYKLRFDLPVKVNDWGYGDQDGLKTAEWTFVINDDSAFGSAGTIAATNMITTL